MTLNLWRLIAPSSIACARREAGLRQTHPARVARHHGVTRARLTQVMNLLLLAPDIQADVLALRFPPGPEPVTERHLRQVL